MSTQSTRWTFPPPAPGGGDPLLDEARGLVPYSQVGKFGRNAAVGAGVLEDIWAAGGVYTGFLVAAATVRVKAGGSVNDTAAGTGARGVTFVGLDSNWNVATETVATAGAGASAATATSFYRVYRAFVATSGTYGGATAAIVDVETSAGTLLARIDLGVAGTGLGQSQQAIYTVPAGYTLYIRRMWADVEGTKQATVRFMQRRDADVVAAPFTSPRVVQAFTSLVGFESADLGSYVSLPAKTDFWAAGIGPAGGAAIEAGFDGVLVATG